MAEKACDGGRVFEDGDFAECAECGTRIRWDLREHPFWGFQNCRDKSPAVAAADRRGESPSFPCASTRSSSEGPS